MFWVGRISRHKIAHYYLGNIPKYQRYCYYLHISIFYIIKSFDCANSLSCVIFYIIEVCDDLTGSYNLIPLTLQEY